MMGVYIKGMEMPEHCGVCRFAVDGWCYAYGKPNIDALANDGRTNFCPLVPVLPHGRLIDADKIGLTNFEIILCQKGNPFKNALEMLLEKIENAPTIIPAEEVE